MSALACLCQVATIAPTANDTFMLAGLKLSSFWIRPQFMHVFSPVHRNITGPRQPFAFSVLMHHKSA